ncbi:MAG: cryptochrome/photolyase family protein [Elstera sp.]
MTAPPPLLVWFRQDLRIGDNPALTAALTRAKADGHPVIAVYCLDETMHSSRALGGASRWWLHHSLSRLAEALATYAIPLILRKGAAEALLPALIAETGARHLYWNRQYESAAIARDTALKTALTAQGVSVESSNGLLLVEPWEVKTGQGKPFQVFTAFWRAARPLAASRPPLAAPEPIRLPTPPAIMSEALESWDLLPTAPDWAGGLRDTWTPGSAGAFARLEGFLASRLAAYADARDRPDMSGTSALSPHLRFGEISPRQIWAALDHACHGQMGETGPETFARELGWREFSYHLLFQNPEMACKPLRSQYENFPWQPDAAALSAWQRGLTGYPIIDAGMRQLWHTGWMHNRVRMLVGSFLVKHLLQPWQAGEEWFWDTLVDADPASNPASWQWVAGCGADAAPYFRIFNPVLQGEKFDPDGAYVRRWVPELVHLPTAFIHKPWDAPPLVLRSAGLSLGQTYPRPIIDLSYGRDRALAALKSLSNLQPESL